MSGATTERPRRGDLYVADADKRPSARVFIEVTRVAKDGSWADLKCMTWAVMWTNRHPLPLRFAVKRDWFEGDLHEQEDDHMAMLRETGRIS